MVTEYIAEKGSEFVAMVVGRSLHRPVVFG